MLTPDERRVLADLGVINNAVAVKFAVDYPKVGRLGARMTLCEMLKYASEGNAFYANSSDHACDAGLYILGQTEMHEKYVNGEYGHGLQIFDSPRAGARLYQHLYRVDGNTFRHLILAPVEAAEFEPDLLVVFADTAKAEIMLRALSYRTGAMWESKFTPAIGCSWIFAYPYVSGCVNHTVTGLGFGMRRRRLFAEGQHLLAIPFDVLPGWLETLREMPWVPEPYGPDGLEYVRNLRLQLGLDEPK